VFTLVPGVKEGWTAADFEAMKQQLLLGAFCALYYVMLCSYLLLLHRLLVLFFFTLSFSNVSIFLRRGFNYFLLCYNYYYITTETCSVVNPLQSRIQQRIFAAKESISRCGTLPNDELVVFVSKMAPVRVAELSKKDLAVLKAKRLAVAEATIAAAEATNSVAAVVAGASISGDISNNNSDGDNVDNVAAADAAATATAAATAAAMLKSAVDIDPQEEILMALARVFSGVLRRDSNLYVIGHRHNALNAIISSAGTGNVTDTGAGPGAGTGTAKPNANASAGVVPIDSLDVNRDVVISFDQQQGLQHDLDGAVPDSLATTVTRVPPGTFGLYLCLVSNYYGSPVVV
jgi:hypothetical protein